VPTYGAGTLLIGERSHTELGGLYQPAAAEPDHPPSQASAPAATEHHPSSTSPLSSSPPRPTSPRPPLHTRPPTGARTLATTKGGTRPSGTAGGDGVVRRAANVWSSPDDALSYRSPVGGGSDALAPLDSLGRTLYPLFCVSVHEHAWMAAGYGVWGKETYLERFWTCLDWAAVRDAYERHAGQALGGRR
jgi:Fe-Mn family superoxide dismutase